mmetsp:Transcript_5637/g.13288  ORF Transcript_5637/g.13288 Transcript_5637/m.13288 type:complete len:932 (+) Transcript_5637:220-3015(+)|eukprot:CAMPEP_0113622660 /NCGR_PEP_ID=MMETSP0017_2-20120614/11625_1 /TAXON_ID=2856 /ORGANISM="Cylindrotheca closterium" /LENGTH=931 /DNA_ID=CAMNT_0000532523 /DNA_START=159 /DNA_END=2954 /DNA_ORIENTATION=+ /assembly_acc=CAM_ASM_000147
MPNITSTALNKIAKEKSKLLAEFFEMEPIHVTVKDPRTKKVKPHAQGEHLLYLWDKIYGNDPVMKSVIVDTVVGPSTPDMDYYDDMEKGNPAMPYQQIRALIGDGGKWKWPEIYKNLDLLPRRGPAWRHIDDPSNLGKIENPNPDITPLKCLVVGGGPVGIRLAIELALGGHRVVLWEKRREIIDEATGLFKAVGFTNRVNRPHINNFCRNDLDRLNGRNFMTAKMCYPVFTNAHTSSIGIDEAQMLLMKTALLIGVDFRLGVGYDGAEIDVDETTSRPSWMVDYSCDEMAQQRYGMEAKGVERFDAHFGCDGGRSRVRSAQVEWLGEPKTRLYKKMFGIVSNLRKVSKKKLKELGYSDGLEPEDRAGQTTGVFFYKASYHNYFICHPSADEMEKNNIPWRGIFAFDKAGGEKNQEKSDMKANLKRFMTNKAKELNIPIDETLENDGFVAAPNDVMGFDFSEFYNCEKNAACFVPPLNWNVETDGEWEIHCPLVALCGDAVADPNWLLGVGLRRGWTSAMDACFFADNIYNNKTFNGKPPDLENPITEPIEWEEHLDNIMNLMQKVGNASREGKLSEEMDTGMLATKGPVVQQIRKKLKSNKVEAPVPPYQIPVSPFFRYKEFQLVVNKSYSGKNVNVNEHPWTTREIAIWEHNNKYVERGDAIKRKVTRPTAAMLTWPKRFECSAFWGMMKLLAVDGKSAPGVGAVPGAKAAGKAAPAPPAPAPAPIVKPKIDTTEVSTRASIKKNRLRESLVEAAMSGPHDTPTSGRNAGINNLLGKFQQPSARQLAQQEANKKPTVGKLNMADQAAPLPIRFRNTKAPDSAPAAPFSPNDMQAIKRLSTQLAENKPFAAPSIGGAVDSGLMSELNVTRLNAEQDVLKARLQFAKAEVAKVQAERAAADAKLAYAQAEMQAAQSLLAAYKDMADMMSGN